MVFSVRLLDCNWLCSPPVLRSRDGSVCLWASLRSVASLQHLCRMAVRRVMPTQRVNALPIPLPMVDYLTYRVI